MGHSRPSSQHTAAALRHGARPARSPPGRRKGRRCAARCQCPGVPRKVSPPQSVPSSPSPTPSQAKTIAGASALPCSVTSADACARWCCTSLVRQAAGACPARRRVVGVCVAQDDFGAHVVESLQVRRHLREHLLAAQRAHVPDVRRHDDAPVPGQRDRRLQVTADGQHGPWHGTRQFEFQRRDAAPQADGTGTTRNDAHDGVVGGPRDRAVVVQEGVRNLGETLLCFRRGRQHGFAAHVAGRRDQRSAEVVQQQLVQRAVRQEDTDLGEARCDVRRKSRARTSDATARSNAPDRARRHVRQVPDRTRRGRRPARPGRATDTSPPAACPGGACARAIAPRLPRCARRTSGDSHRYP